MLINRSPDHLTTVALALESCAFENGRVRLAWHNSEGNFLATVCRRLNQGPWKDVGDVASDAAGRVVFEDPDVQPGQRYGYRLRYQDGPSTVAAGETEIEVPRTAMGITGPTQPERRPPGTLLLASIHRARLLQRLRRDRPSSTYVGSHAPSHRSPGDRPVARAPAARWHLLDPDDPGGPHRPRSGRGVEVASSGSVDRAGPNWRADRRSFAGAGRLV